MHGGSDALHHRGHAPGLGPGYPQARVMTKMAGMRNRMRTSVLVCVIAQESGEISGMLAHLHGSTSGD